VRLGDGRGARHAKRFFFDLEINRTVAGQFAVQFYRNILLARNAQPLGLKIFNLRDANIRAKHNVLQILDDFEVAEPFEN
jgi:hypothetical protein